MDLKEAISHSREIQKSNSDKQCAAEHAQLADWLEELAKLRLVAFHANQLYEICADLPIDFPKADWFVWTMGELKDALKAAGFIYEIKFPEFITVEDQKTIQNMWPRFLEYLKSDKCPEEIGISKLQRVFMTGYAITAKTVEILELNGFIGPMDQDTKLRKVLCKPIDKKMFCFNEDGVASWIIAQDIEQAIVFHENTTGGAMKETFEEEKKGDSNLTWEEFVAGYVREESPDKEFTMHWDKDRVETKTFREFLQEVKEVPSYFACQDY